MVAFFKIKCSEDENFCFCSSFLRIFGFSSGVILIVFLKSCNLLFFFSMYFGGRRREIDWTGIIFLKKNMSRSWLDFFSWLFCWSYIHIKHISNSNMSALKNYMRLFLFLNGLVWYVINSCCVQCGYHLLEEYGSQKTVWQ